MDVQELLEPLPLVLSREEVAKALSISLSSVDRALARGELEHFKIGGRILFAKESVIRFLKLKKFQPEAKVVLSAQELEDRLAVLQLTNEMKEILPIMKRIGDVVSDEDKFKKLSEEKQNQALKIYSALIQRMTELQRDAERLEHERGITMFKDRANGAGQEIR